MGYEETTEDDERDSADYAYALVQLCAEGCYAPVGEDSEQSEPDEITGPVDDDEGYHARDTEALCAQDEGQADGGPPEQEVWITYAHERASYEGRARGVGSGEVYVCLGAHEARAHVQQEYSTSQTDDDAG